MDDNNSVEYWKFSPGADAIYWEEMKKQGVAAIGWGNHSFAGKDRDQIKKLIPESSSRAIGIVKRFFDAKIGDRILAFKGNQLVIGYGEITKVGLYSEQPFTGTNDYHNYHEVKWTPIYPPIKVGIVGMDTFYNISYRWRLEFSKVIPSHESIIEEDTHQKFTMNKPPLNQILYGPPGTGKTYNTINKALEIIGENTVGKTREQIKDLFDTKMKDGQIVFTTFHQSMSYEDFIEGIKPIAPDNEGDPVIYKTIPGIFRNLCVQASSAEAPVTESDTTKSDTEKEEIVRSLSKSDSQNKDLKPHVLIIDEINRGNVSQIFGELITLIEEDKRLNMAEGLEVTLPYSKDKFGVPPNLFIIGTMNTADRSVEALDAALRRRFSFVEMPPKSALIATDGILKEKKGILGSIDLPLMLDTINKRIEKLLDKDHQIGHSYFMTVSNLAQLKSAFQNKIIPLLQEYFFGDYGKIGLVLGKEFFEPVENTEGNPFADFEKYDASDFAERTIYKIKDISNMSDDYFKITINTLLKKSVENQ